MKLRKVTQIMIPVFIALILGYDAYVFLVGGQDATISSVIITEWSKEYPAFTFIIGFAMGHLFWPLKPKDETKLIDKKPQ